MLTYPGRIPLPESTLDFLTERLQARRERPRTWRKLPARDQALLVLAHLRNGDAYERLADGFGVGVATVCRYVHEARPLRTITSTVRECSANSLHRRLGLTGPHDELKELGDTFDQLLDRLAASFHAQRQFVANASHELRTPLSRARTLLEVALRDPTTDLASLRATCARIIAAGEQQERLIEALLTLARSERGLDRRQPVALESVARTLLLNHKPIADRSGLHLDAQLKPPTTMGDTRLLERMVANLLDNALRYNHPGGSVQIHTQVKAGHPTLGVTNSGPAIPADDLDWLWQPFQRGRARRTGNGQGLGLGLSIVEAIATTHGAATSARPRPEGGLELEVRFPIPRS